MMRRKQPSFKNPHNLDPDGLHRPSPTASRKSRKEQQKEERIAYGIIGCFVLIGLSLLIVFRYHHHNISIDDGEELNEEGMPLVSPKEIDSVAVPKQPMHVGVDSTETVAAPGAPGSGDEETASNLQTRDLAASAAAAAAVVAHSSDQKDAVSSVTKNQLRRSSPSEFVAVDGTIAAGAEASASESIEKATSIDNRNCDVESDESTHPRYVTIVIPSVVNPNGRPARLKAISETWGCKARAVFVVHDVSEYVEAQNNHFDMENGGAEYPKLFLMPPEITPDMGVQRLSYLIRKVSESAVDPDFAFFVNDHTFVIPDHACCFLSGRDPSEQLYAGHPMRNKVDKFAFNSGAAGYFLSRETMKGLVQRWDEKDPSCSSDGASEWHQGNPGLLTAKCMSESLSAMAIDTTDEHGWHRFHAFGLIRTVTGHVDQWYKNKHVDLDEYIPGHHNELGVLNECCSAATISFHYVEHSETTALSKVLRDLKENPKMTDDELGGVLTDIWPRGFRNLGGYSHGLPPEKSEQFSSLLTIIRRISAGPTKGKCNGCQFRSE
jgi:hypothetical protein